MPDPQVALACRLAPEMLGIIFVFANQLRSHHWYLFADMKLILSRVCRYWREIVLATSALWTALPVTRATTTSYINHAFQCAKGAPMTVYVHLDPFTHLPGRVADMVTSVSARPIDALCKTILPAVMVYNASIRNLFVRGFDTPDFTEVVRVLRPNGRHLVNLAFHSPFRSNDNVTRLDASLPILPLTPALKALSIDGLIVTRALPTLPTLTHLYLSDTFVQWDNLSAALTSSPLLESLVFTALICVPTDSARPIFMRSLHSMAVLAVYPGCHDDIIDAIVDYLGGVTHLNIRCSHHVDLLELLRHTPSLVNLHINQSKSFTKIATAITSGWLDLNRLEQVTVHDHLDVDEIEPFIVNSTRSVSAWSRSRRAVAVYVTSELPRGDVGAKRSASYCTRLMAVMKFRRVDPTVHVSDAESEANEDMEEAPTSDLEDVEVVGEYSESDTMEAGPAVNAPSDYAASGRSELSRSRSPSPPLPLHSVLGRPFWEFPTGLRLYTVEEGARLCGYPSREAFASSIREEIEAKASRQHQININRQETIARRRLVAESSVRRRSSRLSKHTVLSVSVREPISVRSSNRKPSESPLSSLPASPALDPIDITASPFDVDELPFVLPRVNSSVAVTTDLLSSPAIYAQSPSPPMDIPVPDAAVETDSYVGLWPKALPFGTEMLATAPPYQDAKLSTTIASHTLSALVVAIKTFWDFDTHLFFRIASWHLDREIYLLGSGLVQPPAVIIADRPSIEDARAFATLGQPGCASCIAGKVRCSLQDTYLFEKTGDEFNGLRHEFNAVRAAGKPRRRVIARDPSSITAGHSVSSAPSVYSGGAARTPSVFLPPPPVPFQYSDAPGIALPAHFIAQHIDPALLAGPAELMDTTPVLVDHTPCPAPSRRISQSVQTENLSPQEDVHVQHAVILPDVPLASLDNADLCRLVQSLAARVSYLEGLRGSLRPLSSLAPEDIPSEMVSQCIDAVFSGHFDMLVAFASTRHRLLANTISSDVLRHLEHLFLECHNALSRMLARLDEGRRSAPNVFGSTTAASPL
ncbi:hypothetical protein C8F04DRAFT_1249665 [Mycena alexandri]|uniref:Uncharacterized protein n=1 Tax=Mycena alexandri TaxID=1745969 RepID=A0AAD6THW9_9AGAR|nr:hypothetical protein C8F04DRAFT_1249665 [Mycena alexandri]